MPIAPTHAPAPANGTGAGPARPVPGDGALAAFTALLLAAAGRQDEAASDDAPTDAAAADAAAQPQALDAVALLALPLPASGDRLPIVRAAATGAVDARDARRAGTAAGVPGDAAMRPRAGDVADPAATDEVNPDEVPAVPAAAANAIAMPFGQGYAGGGAGVHGAGTDRPGRQGVAQGGNVPVPAPRGGVVAAEADGKPANGAIAHLPAFGSGADSGPGPARTTDADLPAAVSVWHAGAHPGTPIGASTAPAHVVVEAVHTPAFTPGWQDETVASLAHVVLGRHERAELKLNPAELGPVSIRVDMQADQASVSIVAASPDTRSALEQSLPQLRDLLASQGITLAQADVHDGSGERNAPAPGWPRAERADAATGSAGVDAAPLIRAGPNRLVDVFA